MCRLKMVCHLHQLLSCLSWCPNVVEVVVVIVVVEENMDPLEGDVVHMVADIVAFIRDPGNISIMAGIITSLKNTRRNLITRNGHSWLMLTLLPLVVLLVLIQPLSLVLLTLPLWHYHKTYDRLRQLEFSQSSHSVTRASSSGMNTYIVSPQKS